MGSVFRRGENDDCLVPHYEIAANSEILHFNVIIGIWFESENLSEKAIELRLGGKPPNICGEGHTGVIETLKASIKKTSPMA